MENKICSMCGKIHSDKIKKYCDACAKVAAYMRKKKYQQSQKGKDKAKDWYMNNGGKEYITQQNKTEKSKLRHQEYILKKNYGITLEEKHTMLKNQYGRCAICGDEFENAKSICVDHNHINGNIRGLLCSRCNAGIGFFRESIEILGKAQDYILKHNGF